jgi:hypothetical protein
MDQLSGSKKLHRWLEDHNWPDIVWVGQEDFDWLKENVFGGFDDHGTLKYVNTKFRVKPKPKVELDFSGERVFAEDKRP